MTEEENNAYLKKLQEKAKAMDGMDPEHVESA